MFIVLASVFGNVRLRLTFHSSGFTTGFRKAQCPQERFWKSFLSLTVSAVLGYHKLFVFLVSECFHRAIWRGSSVSD